MTTNELIKNYELPEPAIADYIHRRHIGTGQYGCDYDFILTEGYRGREFPELFLTQGLMQIIIDAQTALLIGDLLEKEPNLFKNFKAWCTAGAESYEIKSGNNLPNRMSIRGPDPSHWAPQKSKLAMDYTFQDESFELLIYEVTHILYERFCEAKSTGQSPWFSIGDLYKLIEAAIAKKIQKASIEP